MKHGSNSEKCQKQSGIKIEENNQNSSEFQKVSKSQKLSNCEQQADFCGKLSNFAIICCRKNMERKDPSKRFVCSVCGLKKNSKSALRQHKFAYHRNVTSSIAGGRMVVTTSSTTSQPDSRIDVRSSDTMLPAGSALGQSGVGLDRIPKLSAAATQCSQAMSTPSMQVVTSTSMMTSCLKASVQAREPAAAPSASTRCSVITLQEADTSVSSTSSLVAVSQTSMTVMPVNSLSVSVDSSTSASSMEIAVQPMTTSIILTDRSSALESDRDTMAAEARQTGARPKAPRSESGGAVVGQQELRSRARARATPPCPVAAAAAGATSGLQEPMSQEGTVQQRSVAATAAGASSRPPNGSSQDQRTAATACSMDVGFSDTDLDLLDSPGCQILDTED